MRTSSKRPSPAVLHRRGTPTFCTTPFLPQTGTRSIRKARARTADRGLSQGIRAVGRAGHPTPPPRRQARNSLPRGPALPRTPSKGADAQEQGLVATGRPRSLRDSETILVAGRIVDSGAHGRTVADCLEREKKRGAEAPLITTLVEGFTRRAGSTVRESARRWSSSKRGRPRRSHHLM